MVGGRGRRAAGSHLSIPPPALCLLCRYGPESQKRSLSLKHEPDFLADLQNDGLPPICLVKPLGRYSEHSGYATIEEEENHLLALLPAIRSSCYWPHSLMLLACETVSFLRLLEWRFGLEPLADRDAAAADLMDALDFSMREELAATTGRALEECACGRLRRPL
ncbi:alkaline phosphatase family protein, partial [Methylacidimicrobium cyclopophantes]|uniref:alkaline phosphatase family protein n=1 Tax=Methylacidimicrobium cyclopophantes TaxID=1041766 RepID=UPI0024822A91